MKERTPLQSSGIFYDSANLENFKVWFEAGVLGGATTNPLILQKENIFDVPGHISKMIEICGPGFPISIELPDSNMSRADMIELALKYRDKFRENAVIKVPMDPRQPAKAYEVIYNLSQQGVRVNATLGVSSGQLILASESMRNSKADGDNYISLFWGRREEAKKLIVESLLKQEEKDALKSNRVLTKDDLKTLRIELDEKVPGAAASLAITLNYLRTHSLSAKIIVGSIRSPLQIERAFALGADIVTIPPKLIEEWLFTQRGVETADQFNEAYTSIKDQVKLI